MVCRVRVVYCTVRGELSVSEEARSLKTVVPPGPLGAKMMVPSNPPKMRIPLRLFSFTFILFPENLFFS
jgi:hypothetical protein